MNSNEPIFVTKPFLPPLEELTPYLTKIWDSKVITNGGPFHQELERALCEYLGVQYISLFSNGTLALLTSLQAMQVTGEVITTPYTFAATTHSLHWHGNTPVFVDVDPETLNLDPTKIAAAITSKTTAIMPVHCYGNPCNTTAIKEVAEANNLKVIYDAAHAFGVRDTEDCSILNHGDLATLSFHATKVFNTFEGGAVICSNAETKERIDQLKNFGFVDETTIVAPGINAKMSEMNAAVGLLQLKHIDAILKRRSEIDKKYRNLLTDLQHIHCLPQIAAKPNYSYFPILIQPNSSFDRDKLYSILKQHKVYARRYFYPLASSFPTYKDLPSAKNENLQVAASASERVLCLPIYPDLSDDQITMICEIIARATNV